MECLQRDLGTIDAVVQHLRRRHTLPIRCPICRRVFGSRAECDAHTQLRSCHAVEDQSPDAHGVTEDQFQRLRELRALPDWADLSEWDRWYVIWNLLFGNIPGPDSPYVDKPIAEELAFARRALASYVSQHSAEELLSMITVNPDSSPQSIPSAALVVEIAFQLMDWQIVDRVIPRVDNLVFLTSNTPQAGEPVAAQHQSSVEVEVELEVLGPQPSNTSVPGIADAHNVHPFLDFYGPFPFNNGEPAFAIQDLAPVIQDLAPVIQDLAPVIQDLAPIIQDWAPLVTPHDFQDFHILSPPPIPTAQPGFIPQLIDPTQDDFQGFTGFQYYNFSAPTGSDPYVSNTGISVTPPLAPPAGPLVAYAPPMSEFRLDGAEVQGPAAVDHDDSVPGGDTAPFDTVLWEAGPGSWEE